MSKRPRRLGIIFQKYDPPLYYVTFNTRNRRAILASHPVHDALRLFFRDGFERGVAVGRYVLMPDHLHVFVQGSGDFNVSQWVRMLRRVLSGSIPHPAPHWQLGFFDHLVRSPASYASKWEYVRENPVRAGLVTHWQDWPFQGKIVEILHI